ncbi:MAG: CCA tRNA nucleotidyltransferase [Planctomycetota bacterium]
MSPLADHSERARHAAVKVVKTLRNDGHVAYLAGGCVRDELLGRQPVDYDVATDAVPDRVSELFRSADLVGRSFGVVIVRLGREDGFVRRQTIEVATFRREAGYDDHRRPSTVEFTDAETDANRRDFTINALFMDPLARGDRRVIDFVGGLSDLEAGVVRAVGRPDARLAEDHLRALRCVRFAARFGFAIDPMTAAAVRRHAAELKGVSVERVGDELRRMLAPATRPAAARHLDELGLTPAVLGREPEQAERVRVTKLRADASRAAALAAWGRDVRPSDAPSRIASTLRERLSLSNDETTAVRGALDGVDRLASGWLDRRVAEQKRDAAAVWFSDAIDLLATTDTGAAASVVARGDELAATPGGIAPKPLVNGDDLIANGHPPGPAFGRVLERVYDAQLEGEIREPGEALALAHQILGEHAADSAG